MIKHPEYPHEPIGSLHALASHLGLTLHELESAISNVDKNHKPGRKILKKDKSFRLTHDAKASLKNIHELINTKLLKRVSYPEYIQGGIADKHKPRSYITHTLLHSNKNIAICEDIATFFPSTSAQQVFKVWSVFFKFAPEVAAALTTLTTFQGELPQGWKTSGYLANLTFFRVEPELVQSIESRGITYSRYIDDITVSSQRSLSTAEKSFCISGICAMLASQGYRLKRSKHEVLRAGRSMEMMGLTINSSKPNLPKRSRHQLRAVIHHLVNCSNTYKQTAEYAQKWQSASAQVARLSSLKAKQAKKLREQLRKAKPQLD